jgi:hypothetical protein
MIRALIVLFAAGSCGILQAAPLVYFALEGREFGSNDPFASNVEVALGDVIEYRLQLNLAPPGDQNQHAGTAPYDERHGISSLSISMLQQATEHIQVNFGTPAALLGDTDPLARDGWNRGTGANGGLLTAREGSPWNDLLAIRPIHQPGLFTGEDDQTVYTGIFEVVALAGQFGQVTPEWGTVSGGGSHFGKRFFMTRKGGFDAANGRPIVGTEVGPDPLAHFTPLTLTASDFQTVPEPSTMALLASALVGLTWCARRGTQTRARS